MSPRKLALLSIAAASVLAQSAHAQYERAWTFGYDVAATPERLVSGGLQATPDGGVIAAQSARVPSVGTAESTASITKFTANGEREWEIVLGTPTPGNFGRQDTVVSPSGDIYACLHRSFGLTTVLRITPAGHVLWETTLPGVDGGGGIELLPNGDVVAGGTYFQGSLYPYIRLFRIDPAGQIVWTSETVQTYLREILVGPTGRIAALGPEDWLEEYQWGQLTMFEGDGSIAWSMRASGNGILLPNGASGWYEEYDAGAFGASGTIYTATNGNIRSGSASQPTFAPGYALHAFDTLGQRTASIYTEGSGAADAEAVAVDEAAGAIYIAGWDADCASGCIERAAIWKYDLAGQEIWMRRVGPMGSLPSRCLAVRVLESGGVALSGVADLGPTLEDAGFHTVLDPSGTTIWTMADNGTYTDDIRTEFGGIAVDPRGNLFTHHQLGEAIVVQKLVPGGPIGVNVCGPAVPNSTGAPGSIRAIGSDAVADDNAVLLLSDLPPNTFAMVVSARSTGFVTNVGGGQGTLCLGGNIGRYDELSELRRTRFDGTSAFQLDLDALQTSQGPIAGMVGEDWYFQAWFRDVNPGATSNLTDAVCVTLR